MDKPADQLEEIKQTPKKIDKYKETRVSYYKRNAKQKCEYEHDYYAKNKEKILEKAKEKRVNSSSGRPRGRPKKYVDDAPEIVQYA